MARRRINWEEEEKKTERIRIRGFYTSIFSFLVAVVFLVGATRFNNSLSIYQGIVMIGCMFAAVTVLVVTMRRRSKIAKKIEAEKMNFDSKERADSDE